MSNWVQHKSGNGEKWEIVQDVDNTVNGHGWIVLGKKDPRTYYFLPRSEYVTWDHPEEWEDVTAECEASEKTKGGEICICHGNYRVEGWGRSSYRFEKIDGLHNGPAFIVKRRKS